MTTPLSGLPHPERPGKISGALALSPRSPGSNRGDRGGGAFVAMTAMVFVNVVCRYLFNDPIPGSDELATLAFTWSTFLGASLGIKRQIHLGIEFVTRLFPPRIQALCGVLVSALIALFAFLLLLYSWHIMRSAHLKLTPVLQWP